MAGWALGTWILTAVGGAYLWSLTAGANREESTARASNLPPSVLFLHPLLALAGLCVWIGYLYTGADELPWVAFTILVLTAVLGGLLHLRTVRRTKVHVPSLQSPDMTPAENAQANRARVEDRMPRPMIHLHGALAGLTLVLVLLEALDIG